MAISRFDRPTKQRIISQYVPQDMNMIARVLAAKQGRYDAAEAKFEAVQDQLTSLKALPGADADILAKSGAQMNELATAYTNKDIGDPRIAKELRGAAKKIYLDPAIRDTQTSLASFQQYQKDIQKLNTDGEYRDENDVFQDQLKAYSESGGAAVNGPLQYSGTIKGVSERETAEKFVDNMATIGRHQFVQLGKTIKKVGWEGMTMAQLGGIDEDGKLVGVVGQSIYQFGNTAAGQQSQRRFNKLQKRGVIPADARVEQYWAGILTSAGAERVGTKQTTGDASGMSEDGKFGDSNYGDPITSVMTVTPMQRTIKDIEFEKNEQGKYELLGSGSLGAWEAVTTGRVLEYITDNDDVTKEDKEKVVSLHVLANEVYGGDVKKAADRINDDRSPIGMKVSPTKMANRSKAFFNESAGNFMKYTIIGPDGVRMSGTEWGEKLDLMDDGIWNSSAKAKVQVDAIHNPASGYMVKGLHVSVKGVPYLVEEPLNDNDGAAKSAFIIAEVQASGVTQPIDGIIYYEDKTGTWPGGIGEINIYSKEGKEKIQEYDKR
jgi:hypothetical protein